MPGLLDVAPSLKTVPINGTDVSVPGISAAGVAALLERFPDLRKLFVGKEVAFSANDAVTLGPQVVAAIIAAGCGAPGSKEAEDKAASFGVGVQLELLEAIISVTMPQGVGPFLERLTALLGVAGVAAPAPSTNTADTK